MYRLKRVRTTTTNSLLTRFPAVELPTIFKIWNALCMCFVCVCVRARARASRVFALARCCTQLTVKSLSLNQERTQTSYQVILLLVWSRHLILRVALRMATQQRGPHRPTTTGLCQPSTRAAASKQALCSINYLHCQGVATLTRRRAHNKHLSLQQQ